MSYLDPLGAGRAQTADKAALDIVGDIELIAAIRSNDYATTIDDQTLFRKWQGGGDNRSWDWYLTPTGQLGLAWTTDGTAGTQETRLSVDTVLVEAGVSDGDDMWVRTTLNVDTGSAYEVRYYYSLNSIGTPVGSVAWTEFAELWTGGAVTSIHSGTTAMDVGANGGNGEDFIGRIYGVWLYDGIGGTEVANPDWRTTTQGDWNSPPVTDDHTNSWDFLGTADWIDDGRPPGARHIITPRQSLHRRQHQVFT